MPSHLANRLVHIQLEVDFDDWKDWAYKNRIRSEIIAYLNYCHVGGGSKTHARLYNDYNFKFKAYPSPRSWEMASEQFEIYSDDRKLLQEAIAGCVGEGVATEFMGFLRIFHDLPDPERILKGEDVVPSEPSQLYALCGALAARYANKPSTLGKRILLYSYKLPEEFAVLLVRDCVRADDEITTTPEWHDWAEKFKRVILYDYTPT